MKEFIQPVKKSKGNISQDKLDSFIGTFNSAIRKGKYSLNTGLSNIQRLSDDEFEAARVQAAKNGYYLMAFEDNYQTITYKLELFE